MNPFINCTDTQIKSKYIYFTFYLLFLWRNLIESNQLNVYSKILLQYQYDVEYKWNPYINYILSELKSFLLKDKDNRNFFNFLISTVKVNVLELDFSS